MNKFSYRIILLLVATAALFSSCSDDDVRASFTIAGTAIYFSELGDVATISYSGSDIVDLEYDEDDLPSGWKISISRGNQTITVYGPTTQEDFEESLTSSTVTFTATSCDDLYTYGYLILGTTDNSAIDITDQQSNCFIVSQANTIYQFNAMVKGENNESISTARVDLLWQTSPSPLTYISLAGDMVQFYVNIDDEDDADDDGVYDDIIEGNAVIAAYNSSGDIIWTWHIWVSDFSAEDSAVTLNGTTVMSRNLGAKENATWGEDIDDGIDEDQVAILDSYGMYYQWGRKDPFVGPYYYNAASGTDATMLSQDGLSTSITYSESTSTIGKVSYTIKNPTTFILGVEDSSYDWLYSSHSSDLWGDTKTIYDPCPKGWRVASPELFEALSIAPLTESEHAAIYDDYGWELTDAAGNKALFMGLGRRGYITGKIQNVNDDLYYPAPWAGYYWTTQADTATNNSATALFFSYNESGAEYDSKSMESLYRSNGMQVRCQRDE